MKVFASILGVFLFFPLLSQIELIEQDFGRMMMGTEKVLKPFHVDKNYCIEYTNSVTCVVEFEYSQEIQLKFFKNIPHYVFVYFKRDIARDFDSFDYTGDLKDIEENLINFLVHTVDVYLYQRVRPP